MILLQCWDDGVEDDIRLTAILRDLGATATFNLNPGLHGPQRGSSWMFQDRKEVKRLARDELQDVYEGFSIANHSVSHPWPCKIEPEAWRSEVFDARKQLQDWFDQPVNGFVYPYGERDESTDAVVSEAGHTYIRGTWAFDPTSRLTADGVPILFPDIHFLAENREDVFQSALESGQETFYFWGHSYELVEEEQWESFIAFLKVMNDHPDTSWGNLEEVAECRLKQNGWEST